LLTPREPVQDGYLLLSDAPGLGYRLNPELVEAHRAGGASAVDSTKVVVT
jgi:L-alanine-DL-glutamate epimerase-like enolase superfamily enzyme